MTAAYLYIRFSSPKQEKGSSAERQLQNCREFIARKGWVEAEKPIEDLGRSAWKGDHLRSGRLGEFAERIFKGEIPRGSVLVVEHLDRLSRLKARTTLKWIEAVCDMGIKIAVVSGDKVYDAENLNANLLSILEVLFVAENANRFTEVLSQRVKASYVRRQNEARESNTAVTSTGPAWLKPEGKRPHIRWIPIPERTRLVREMYDMAAEGIPPWNIAKAFNERGEPSFTGKPWERTTIVKILRSRAVEGDHVVGTGKKSIPTGEVWVGYYLDSSRVPIVPPDVVAQARAMLDRRRRGSGRNSGTVNNLFGQRIRCGTCGGRMMQVGYQSRYLTCYDAARGNGCTNRASFKYRPLEKAVLDDILHLALDDRFFRQAQKSNHLTQEIAEIEKAIRDRQAEVSRLGDTLSRIASPTLEAKVAGIEASIAELRIRLATLNDQLAEAQGAATAEAHLSRVHSFRDALVHAQDEIRIPARLRASEALAGVIDCIVARSPPKQQRTFLMVAIGGAHQVVFDNEGNKWLAQKPGMPGRPGPSLKRFVWPEDYDMSRVEAYLRRNVKSV